MGRSKPPQQPVNSNYPELIYGNKLAISYKRCKRLEQAAYRSLSNSKRIAKLLREIWNSDDFYVRESFYLLCLSRRLDLIGFYKLSDGGLDCIAVDDRLLFTAALLCRASSIVIAHNHPSGSLSPSHADIAVTKRIMRAGELLSIKLLDHIILTPDSHYSFLDHGDL